MLLGIYNLTPMYRIENISGKGRGLLSNKILSQFTRLVDKITNRSSFSPIVPPVLLSRYQNTRCAICFSELSVRRYTSRTESKTSYWKHFFCSDACRRKGLLYQFDEEERLFPTFSSIIILLYRIAIKGHNKLVSMETMSYTPVNEKCSIIASALRKYLLNDYQCSLDYLKVMVSKLITNAFSVTNGECVPIGISMYSTPAYKINHSCLPNLTHTFDYGRGHGILPKLSLTTVRDVEENEELTISYVDVTNVRFRRRKILYKDYNFLCQCVRCKMDGKTDKSRTTYIKEDDLVTGLKCPTSKCNGYGVSVNDFYPDETINDNCYKIRKYRGIYKYECNICGNIDFEPMIKKRDEAFTNVEQWNYYQSIQRNAYTLISSYYQFDKMLEYESNNFNITTKDLDESYKIILQTCHYSSWFLYETGYTLSLSLLENIDSLPDNYHYIKSKETLSWRVLSIWNEIENKSFDHRLNKQYIPHLTLLIRKFRIAKMNLFLKPDPREAFLMLQEIKVVAAKFYNVNHEFMIELESCIERSFQ